MLVILNGAPKGGSTWLVLIVQAMQLFHRIPEQYQDEKWINSSIKEELIGDFIEKIDYQNQNFFCKQHWINSNQVKAINVLENPNVKMVNIIRDIRDVLVSRYFHDLRLNLTKSENADDYYWKEGRENMIKYMNYHTSWHAPGIGYQPFLCSYERLHRNFSGQMQELVGHLGLEDQITLADIERIRQATSIDTRKEKGKGKFFRKGIVGDWQNHLSDSVVEDLHKTAIKENYIQTKKNMMKTFKLGIVKEIDFGV